MLGIGRGLGSRGAGPAYRSQYPDFGKKHLSGQLSGVCSEQSKNRFWSTDIFHMQSRTNHCGRRRNDPNSLLSLQCNLRDCCKMHKRNKWLKEGVNQEMVDFARLTNCTIIASEGRMAFTATVDAISVAVAVAPGTTISPVARITLPANLTDAH